MDNQTITLERQPCEVYSRVVGYIRPIDQWNAGKRSEFNDRMVFSISHSSMLGDG